MSHDDHLAQLEHWRDLDAIPEPTHCLECGRDWEDCEMDQHGEWYTGRDGAACCHDCYARYSFEQSMHETLDLLAEAVTDWPEEHITLADYVTAAKARIAEYLG